MEFIITGLFIIFFSYILLYSLYDFLFKRSIIEGVVVHGDKKDDNEDDEQAKAKQKAFLGPCKAPGGSPKGTETVGSCWTLAS